jgi:hypothetical protein
LQGAILRKNSSEPPRQSVLEKKSLSNCEVATLQLYFRFTIFEIHSAKNRLRTKTQKKSQLFNSDLMDVMRITKKHEKLECIFS